jgi:ABC-type sugar transport system substrate-binding protein
MARWLAALLALAMLASACGGSDAEGSQVAYLSASSANTWLAASLAEMEKVAAEEGITITEFDAAFDAAAQTQQFQDAVASGQYDGIVLVSLSGAGSIPDVEAALADHPQATPDRVLVIGDTVHDVGCAKAHGCVSIAVTTGQTPAADLHAAGADHVIDDLRAFDW